MDTHGVMGLQSCMSPIFLDGSLSSSYALPAHKVSAPNRAGRPAANGLQTAWLAAVLIHGCAIEACSRTAGWPRVVQETAQPPVLGKENLCGAKVTYVSATHGEPAGGSGQGSQRGCLLCVQVPIIWLAEDCDHYQCGKLRSAECPAPCIFPTLRACNQRHRCRIRSSARHCRARRL